MQVEIVVPVVSMITLFVILPAIAGIVIINYFKARNRERLLLIEKGINPLEFDNANRSLEPKRTPLSKGLLMAGVGTGLATAYLINKFIGVHKLIDHMVLSFALAFALGGLGLILGHYLENKKKRDISI